VARRAWRRLREKLTHISGSGRAGLADEEAGEAAAQGDVRAEPPGDDEGSPQPEYTALVGCFTVLGVIFAISLMIIVVSAVAGQLDHVSLGGAVLLVVAGLVISMPLTALAWRARTARKRRSERPSEVNPPSEHTEDDQNPVAKP
jgi:hypothetical protein